MTQQLAETNAQMRRGPDASFDVDDALRVLYVEHRHALLAYAKRFTADHGRAEDVVQETFTRAWRHLPALLEHDRPVRPWLLRVARHLLIDSARADRIRPLVSDGRASSEPSVDDGVDNRLNGSLVLDAIRQLSPAHRQIVVETYFYGTPVNVVAARLGVPAGTARSRLHYALHQLRQQLEPAIA